MDGFMFVLLERGSITCVISISFKGELLLKRSENGTHLPFLWNERLLHIAHRQPKHCAIEDPQGNEDAVGRGKGFISLVSGPFSVTTQEAKECGPALSKSTVRKQILLVYVEVALDNKYIAWFLPLGYSIEFHCGSLKNKWMCKVRM